MKNQLIKIVSVALMLFATTAHAQDARALISKVVEANGGIDALQKLKDVSFEYTFRVEQKNAVDLSTERYIFDGEVSFAQYSERQVYALPQMPGTHTQFFNGTETVSQLDDKKITDQQAAYIGHALRKTNYYWFAMMFKLLDPGVQHKLLPTRTVDGIAYQVVEMTFGEHVGEASDRFVLYINPETFRIDQFLFTAVGFGVTDPSLMKVSYEKIDGVYLTTYRKYAPADWDGEVKEDAWIEQTTRNVKFNNGYNLESIQQSF